MIQSIYDFQDMIKLVDLSNGYRFCDFTCEFEEYNKFLRDEAIGLQEAEISKVHLLINKENADIIAFMALSTDSIKLSSLEKDSHKIGFVNFEAIPSMKIGKLAVDMKYKERFKGIGSLMIELARGITEDLRNAGIACRFIILDADTKNNSTVVEFYKKQGFLCNEKYKRGNTSMRLDVLYDEVIDVVEETGT